MINTTLLVVIVRSLLSVQIKLAIKSDLMSLNALLMLTIFLLDNTINLFELAVLIRTKTCHLDKYFTIILSLGLSFLNLFRTL